MDENERKAQMIRMYRDNLSYAEIGRFFGLSRERVRQIIGAEVIKRPAIANWRGDARVVVAALGKDTDRAVAERFGLNVKNVAKLRIRLGIPAYQKPIGCDKCQSNHYARGMCKNCYRRWRYALKKETV